MTVPSSRSALGARRGETAPQGQSRHARRQRIPRALGLAAVLSGVMCASAAGAVCKYQPPVSAYNERIGNAISSRALWGLPRARPFVERLDRDRAAARRGYAILDFPMTVREARYFLDRERVEREAAAVDAVVRRSPNLSGGISIEDAYPRGAYLLLRVTRRLTAGELRRVRGVARRVRGRRVKYSERYLDRLADQVSFTVLDGQGIAAHEVGADIDRNAVAIMYSSERPDAEAVMTKRYGRALVFEKVPALTATCESPTSYKIGSDGITLTVRWGTSGSAANHRVEVQELPDRVIVGGVSDYPPFSTADLRLRQATTTLTAPLGQRPVVSAITRKATRLRATAS